MTIVTGHKGKVAQRCHVRGLECHSSLAPRGVNAVEAAARVIAHLSDLGRRKASEGPFDERYDVPHTTAHCGVVAGGTALNIVPADCSFEFEFRTLPDDDPAALLSELQDYAQREIEPTMRAIAPASGFDWEAISSFPGLDVPEDAEVVALAKALTGANGTGKVAFGTEAGLFQRHGIPAVVCGPGSIEQAHKPDEFVELDQIVLCERFMDRLLDRVAAG
jgi:acetylornithine deacetylase